MSDRHEQVIAAFNMADDEQDYRNMYDEITPEDIAKVQRVMAAWTAALDELNDAGDIRIVHIACIKTIEMMGLDYHKHAVDLLSQMATLKQH